MSNSQRIDKRKPEGGGRRRLSMLLVGILVGMTGGPSLVGAEGLKPISNRLISASVTLPNGHSREVTVLEGTIASIQNREEGYRYGLIPVIVDESSQRVAITVVELTEHGRGLSALREVETLELVRGFRAKTTRGVELEVEITGIRSSDWKPDEVHHKPVSSPRLVTGQAILPNGNPARFSLLEGATLALRNRRDGFHVKVTPVVADETLGVVQFSLSEVLEEEDGREAPLGTVLAFKGTPTAKKAGLSLEVTEIYSEVLKAAGGDCKCKNANADCPEPDVDCCCVTCDGTKTCGCSVADTCGSCCVSPCC